MSNKKEESEWMITWHGEDYYGTYKYLASITRGYVGPVIIKVI